MLRRAERVAMIEVPVLKGLSPEILRMWHAGS